MFGIGTSELILILVLALLIVGPKDLPRIGREAGRVFRRFQRAADDVKKSINLEMIKEVEIEAEDVFAQEEKGKKDKRIEEIE